jgi:diaminohydroxyphosphoribosylaminopyrimidine deaminase/5-amino-6-(5-phosphoribosylamino)uracil reductase
MERALFHAARGAGAPVPNRSSARHHRVDGVVVGQGFHRRAGEPHAEVHALAEGRRAPAATLYCTRSRAATRGTGPCVSRIVDAGVARVVAAVDPNWPSADAALRSAERGVTVDVGLLPRTPSR